MEAGYRTDGSLVLAQTRLDAAGDPLSVPTDYVGDIRAEQGVVSLKDRDGGPLYATGPGEGPSLQDILGADSQDPLQLFGGLVTDRLFPSSPDKSAVGSSRPFDGGTITVTDVRTKKNGRTTVFETVTPTDPDIDPIPMRRIYVWDRVQNLYVLERVQVDVDIQRDGFRLRGMAEYRFDSVGWHRNEMRDAARGGESWGQQQTSLEPWQPPACGPGEWGNPDIPEGCDPNSPGGSTGGTSIPACSFVPGGANLVYAHGFGSNGDNWGTDGSRVRGRTTCEFEINDDRNPTYGDGGLASHSDQAYELGQVTDSFGQDNLIFIAHSQGGLISRRVAQRYANDLHQPDKVQAIVTIGTPHVGALIAENVPTTPAEWALRNAERGAVCALAGSGCNVIQQSARAVVEGLLVGFGGTGSPAARDITIGSDALQALNSGAEEDFLRYGIRHEVSKRWAMARLGGDIAFVNGGPYAVSVFDGLVIAAGVAAVTSIWQPWLWGLTAIAIRFLWEAYMLDNWWNEITSGGDRSDGFIQASSQWYPGADRNINARIPTSHTGEPKAERSFLEVRDVMELNLELTPRRP